MNMDSAAFWLLGWCICHLRGVTIGFIPKDITTSRDGSGETSETDFLEVPPVLEITDITTDRELQSSNPPPVKTCIISIREDIKNPQPVFLQTNSNEFYPYSDTGVLQVVTGNTLQIWCSSSFTSFTTQLLTITCVRDSLFRVDDVDYDFKEFTCRTWPVFTAQKTGLMCNGTNTLIRVGFEITAHRFAEQMLVCFDEREEVTRYVLHHLTSGNQYYQTNVDRLSFQTGGFFNSKNVAKLYTQSTQQETINVQLGGVGTQYFNASQNLYLARGHIAAKTDFVYGTQQRATFLFINAAPQWQVFNAGNWARIEDSLRAWVSKRGVSVECYTGVWGVATLPDVKGVETPLYLHRDENNNGLIPVPKLFFRVVIEPATQRGIVFVGINNPHLTLEQIVGDYVICSDVSELVTYISWKKRDIKAGYSYACEVEEFLRVVTHLPKLSAPGGLLI